MWPFYNIHIVSKNLIPYSSANACPLTVATAYKKNSTLVMNMSGKKHTPENFFFFDKFHSLPFRSHPCQLCYPPIFCWHCQKHAVQCSWSSSWCLHNYWIRDHEYVKFHVSHFSFQLIWLTDTIWAEKPHKKSKWAEEEKMRYYYKMIHQLHCRPTIYPLLPCNNL